MAQTHNTEVVKYLDEYLEPQGPVSREEAHRRKLLHPVVDLIVSDTNGRLLLLNNNFLIGGHVRWGESLKEALRREWEEETGISFGKLKNVKFLGCMVNHWEGGRCLNYIFSAELEGVPQHAEVANPSDERITSLARKDPIYKIALLLRYGRGRGGSLLTRQKSPQ